MKRAKPPPREPRRPPTVADGWDAVRPNFLDATPEQLGGLRRAFYEGVDWVLTTIGGEVQGRPPEEGALLMDDLVLELRRYLRAVAKEQS